MATLAKKIEVETKVRAMLEAEGMPLPDWIEYGEGCVRLFWEESRTVLVVDIDEPEEGDVDFGDGEEGEDAHGLAD
jgi:hypothetical protein